jgi:DNA repair exonuclease SbcCD ATPase subunit
MPLTVLQAPGDADQLAEDGARTAPGQDARALLEQLHSALAVKSETSTPSANSLSPVIEQVAHESSSFGRAVAKQANQIQLLIEQINRLDGDTQIAELRGVVRDIYGALNDVVLRMKQNASDVTAKIGLLTGAVTIIGGASDMDVPHGPEQIMDAATAAAERILSLERLQKEAGSAILALEEIASHAQHAVRDLSAGLAKLSAHVESDRNEIANLHQRIGSTDRSLAEGLAKLNGAAKSDRNEISRLHQRIETANQSLAQKLAGVDSSFESDRNAISRLHQRIESTDQASTAGLTTLAERTATMRDEIGRMFDRLSSVESSTALVAGFREEMDVLGLRLEETEHRTAAEISSWKVNDTDRFAALANRLEAQERKSQILSHDAEQMAARMQAVERAIATMTQSQKALSTWQDRLAQVLAGPQLPAV